MPLYDFSCPTCGTHFEKRLSFNESPAGITCPNGHTNVQRVYTAPVVQFKGSGWYVTDSRKGSSTPSETGD